MRAREIMTPRPEVVTPTDSTQRAATIMRDMDVGFVPVVDDRSHMNLQGVITDRDIAIRHVAEGHSKQCKVQAHMTADGIQTVGPDDDVSRVMEVMRRSQVRRVPVVDNGCLVGVIAQADVAEEQASSRPEDVARTVEEISEPAHPRQ